MFIKIWTEEDIEKLELALNNIAFNIIDVFEEFLEEKGINIENEDKEGDESEAIIYGMDYGRLESDIIETLSYHVPNNVDWSV